MECLARERIHQPAHLAPCRFLIELQGHHAEVAVHILRVGGAVLGIVVEVQLGRDGDKSYTWPSYVISLRQRLRCPVELLVVCVDDGVARWAHSRYRSGGHR